MAKELRRANGTGSIYKLTGRRRHPYVAAITTRCNYDQAKHSYNQSRAVIGYYPTRDAATLALSDYLADPYDLTKQRITFEELYKEWSDLRFPQLTPSAIRTWQSAYKYFSPIYSKHFHDLRTLDIEKCIENANVHSSTKKRMKPLCNLLYKYAIKHEYVHTNYAVLCDSIHDDPPLITRTPFTEDEISILWDNINEPYADIVLIAIYSGWRPQELMNLRADDINLIEEYMIGGMKTRSGKDRIVPIHKKIIPLIKNRVANSSNYLFYIDTADGPIKLDYYKYRHRFNKLMQKLNMNHRPHDTRHTFITMGKEAGMNEYILKLIVGHSIDDITEHVYTHRKIQSLKDEMDKIQ